MQNCNDIDADSVLAVSSSPFSGGHTAEMLKLVESLDKQRCVRACLPACLPVLQSPDV